ncbi:mannose-binding lectin [Guyanagaster necrorhizus]|uniref:Mannose-binding lectin n=1 Tax=Guyanagaster necrorhizus TaxID=856835 RepID=A0A9P8AUC8_9AGAR|nr:mannose-binding lectin [Guyanagaster necrorhizus MCA 3950]KAG7448354.1 mannose-binding lectin [Guyanagaster necrorhizus MCA 3950]
MFSPSVWSVVLVSSLFARFTTADTTSGTFSLLTYNVAGLPEGLSSSNPATNTPLISERLGPYNVINVEEDFNYHAELYANDSHPYRTPTSGGAGIGSGLNTLSDFEYIDLERTTWDECYIDSGDCLTPKGFTLVRIRVSAGAWIDLYNLHTDAGDEEGDLEARAANIAQLVAYMDTWSAGMAVIIMGDTNSRYTRESDSEALHGMIDDTGSTDAWISNIRGGSYPAEGSAALVCDFPFPNGTTQAEMVSCEVVDKIFTRPSSIIALSTTSFTNEDDNFLTDDGAPLSDHYPMSATASWSLSSSLRLSDPAGGPHGDPFNDIATSLSGDVPTLTSITIRSGSRVDAVSYDLAYPGGSTSTVYHGGTGGDDNTLSLGDGEYITQITACSAKYNDHTRVFYLALTTNAGTVLEGGVATDDCLTTVVPTDAGSGGEWGLVGFWGRSGDETDRLGGIWGAVY